MTPRDKDEANTEKAINPSLNPRGRDRRWKKFTNRSKTARIKIKASKVIVICIRQQKMARWKKTREKSICAWLIEYGASTTVKGDEGDAAIETWACISEGEAAARVKLGGIGGTPWQRSKRPNLFHYGGSQTENCRWMWVQMRYSSPSTSTGRIQPQVHGSPGEWRPGSFQLGQQLETFS